ncbi:MFS transporter [Mangrovactinospora gilvigrisea]|uniref:MFS transporter n=2 Tax=Mangrovactinospora gilvigrisea TaxID=1428644 RepID=A0A1J7BZ19_9ACTN|nr:MFS transporter [Mangrovactinospora gilvigrisea]
MPWAVYMLAAGTFLMGTTEFVVAGLLPEIADDLGVGVARTGLLITVFAVGMIVGAPLMTLLTLRIPRRVTLLLALGVFALGHVVVAVGTGFPLLLAARFATALATGAFWSVASVVATRAAGPGATARALALVGSGGMLANVVGVPLGAFIGQVMGWRGPFWVLAALAAAAAVLIARAVPADGPNRREVSVRTELAGLGSTGLWWALAACATTTGGVLSTYSYIAPLLTGRAGIAASLVPLVLVGFGIGALAGTVSGGRLGDARPHATTIAAAGSTTAVLLALCLLSGTTWLVVALVAVLGFVGLGANPILSSFAVRFAEQAPTLAVALTVSAFNLGTALGTPLAGRALDSGLGTLGPAAVGAAISALTLLPTIALATGRRRRPADAARGTDATGPHARGRTS